eukprot:515791_1
MKMLVLQLLFAFMLFDAAVFCSDREYKGGTEKFIRKRYKYTTPPASLRHQARVQKYDRKILDKSVDRYVGNVIDTATLRMESNLLKIDLNINAARLPAKAKYVKYLGMFPFCENPKNKKDYSG